MNQEIMKEIGIGFQPVDVYVKAVCRVLNVRRISDLKIIPHQ